MSAAARTTEGAPPGLPRVLLVSTGGTITMTPGQGAGIAPTLSAQDLVAAVPELATRAELAVWTYSQKPGASLDLQDLVNLSHELAQRLREGFAGAVLVQGTDTIEETAFVLDLLRSGPQPLVVTGAMRGAGAPGADGPANLLAAVTVAGDAALADQGTLVVLNDEVHAARFVQKGHTALPSAFHSPGAAPIARVIEGRVRVSVRLPGSARLARPAQLAGSEVALIKLVLGDDGRLLAELPRLGYRGAVIEAMGAGHVPAPWADKLQALAEAMPVVLATRVAAGPVFTGTYGFAGSETDLIARGLWPAGDLPGPKACLLLRLLLAQGWTGEPLRLAFAAVRDGHALPASGPGF